MRGLKAALGAIESILSESAAKEGNKIKFLLDTTHKTYESDNDGEPYHVWAQFRFDEFERMLREEHGGRRDFAVYDGKTGDLCADKDLAYVIFNYGLDERQEEADEYQIYFDKVGELVVEWRDSYHGWKGEFCVMGLNADMLSVEDKENEVWRAVRDEGDIPKKYKRFFYSLKS